MKLQRWDRHTIDQTLAVLAQIQAAQKNLADQIDRLHQVPPSPVEPALRWNAWKQVAVSLPATQQFRFHMPTAAFSDKLIAINSLSPHSGFGPGRLKKGASGFQISSTTTNTQMQKLSWFVIIRMSSLWQG